MLRINTVMALAERVLPRRSVPLKALLMENNAILALDLEMIAEGCGYKVRLAHSESEALDIAKLWDPDILLVDMDMEGGGSPMRAAEAIWRLNGLRVVTLSTSEEDDSSCSFPKARVTKPFSYGQLTQVLTDTCVRPN